LIFIKIKKEKMKFGELKSKVENVLMESYIKGTFKSELKNFKNYVLSNKNVTKLFYLYDELNSNKGLNESVVDSFIKECTDTYEKTMANIKTSQLNVIKKWVGKDATPNKYENIDSLFSNDVLVIESKIESKKIISENLKKSPKKIKESFNLPLDSILTVANKTLNSYISNLSESEREELFELLSESDDKLSNEFNSLKSKVMDKLKGISENSDDTETKTKIVETINKINSEKYDKLNYYKLKSLNENI
jgi:hypothetical protein